MLALRQTTARCIQSAVVFLFASTLVNAASVTVDPTVTTVGGLYHYAYSITNNTPDDAFVIDISVPHNPSAVIDLVAPAGFTAAFDSGLGLVSFLEDAGSFSAIPSSGFSFDSPDGPGLDAFAATLVSTSSGSLYTVSGQTLGPVPEPAYTAFLAFALLVPGFVLRRRRSQMSKPEKQD